MVCRQMTAGQIITIGKLVSTIGVKELLEAGVHFGHQTKRWNPKMKQFIFGARNGIYIIDLGKTVVQLETACAQMAQIVSKGGKILMVGNQETGSGSHQGICGCLWPVFCD